MTTAQFETMGEIEAAVLLGARFRALVAAGYDPTNALIVATHVEVELGPAVASAQRGCPPALALRILL